MNTRILFAALLATSLANAQPAAQEPAPAKSDNPAAAADNLDTLAQQAPNAVAWVLAPLDSAVPPDIRQNLTYLREALLDEAARAPAAGAGAYKVGEQLCNTMIGALDERDRSLVRAGFRAVEAKTRTGVSSEALDARRNYKMSWPQFVREQTQRSELKDQAVNNATVMAERPKLEWSQRADQIRPTLDLLYKQFREALRKIPGRHLTAIAPSAPVSVVPATQAPPAPVPAVTKQIGTASIEGKLQNTTWHWSGKQNITFLANGKATWTMDKRVLDWRVQSEAERTIEGHTPSGRPFAIAFDSELQSGSLREDRFAPRDTTRISGKTR